MNANRWTVIAVLLPLLCASWLLLIVAYPAGGGGSQRLFVGFLLGTMFGQTTMAAAWAAWGPARVMWRLPLSLAWVAVLLLALIANFAIHDDAIDSQIVIFMGLCLAGQWLLVQALLGGLAIGYGIHIRHRDDSRVLTAGSRQFGIRQLMILTAIVAVVLGAGRAVIPTASTALQGRGSEFAIFAFLTAAGIVITLPLLAAALLRRYAWRATIVVLGLIAAATWWELPLVNMAGGGPDIWHLIYINTFQTAWVLAIVLVVRMCGYGFGQPASSPFASSR